MPIDHEVIIKVADAEEYSSEDEIGKRFWTTDIFSRCIFKGQL